MRVTWMRTAGRAAWGLARALTLFSGGIALAFALWPPFRMEMSRYLNGPRARAYPYVRKRWIRQPPPGRPDQVPFLDPVPARRPGVGRWDRVMEVASGQRRFAREDRATLEDQRLAIESFVDWYSQLESFRREKLQRHGAPARMDVVTAVLFHLEGLDQDGRRERWLDVVDALLSYVEDLRSWVDRLACQDRVLRHVLRHLAEVRHSAGEYDRLAARLDRHFAAVGTLASNLPPGVAAALAVALAFAGGPESEWPERTMECRVFLGNPVEGAASETAALREALLMPPRAGLAHLAKFDVVRAAERKAPLPARTRILGLLTLSRSIISTPWDVTFARAAYLRELEWATRRTATQAVIRLLAEESRGRAWPALSPTDPFTGAPISLRRQRSGFRIHAAGRNGRDEGGAGDDLVVWPPPPSTVAGGPAAEEEPRAWPFDRPLDAFSAALEACENRRLPWRVLMFERPAGAADRLARARMQISAAARFHELGALLGSSHLGATGGSGEIVQETAGLRSLHYEVRVPPGCATHRRARIVRFSVATARELAGRLANLGSRTAPGEVDVQRLVALRTGERIWLTALVVQDPAAESTRGGNHAPARPPADPASLDRISGARAVLPVPP